MSAFFFIDTATTKIYTLSLHDALPIFGKFLDKRGEGLHHVAIRVPDLNASIERLRASGARLLNDPRPGAGGQDRKSTRLNSSHSSISYAVFCLKKKKRTDCNPPTTAA